MGVISSLALLAPGSKTGRGAADVLCVGLGCGHCSDAPVAAAGAAGLTEGAAAACQHCYPQAGNGAGERRDPARSARGRGAPARTRRSLEALAWGPMWGAGGSSSLSCQLGPITRPVPPLLSLPNCVSPSTLKSGSDSPSRKPADLITLQPSVLLDRGSTFLPPPVLHLCSGLSPSPSVAYL